MRYGCHSMVGKIESILIKRPQEAFISQEHLDANYENLTILALPIMKGYAEYEAFEKNT